MEKAIVFLVYFLVHWGVLVVLYKYDLKNRIALFAKYTKIKLIYELSHCEFCIEHHVGVFIAPLFGLYLGWDWVLLLFPFLSASLSNIVKKISYK